MIVHRRGNVKLSGANSAGDRAEAGRGSEPKGQLNKKKDAEDKGDMNNVDG